MTSIRRRALLGTTLGPLLGPQALQAQPTPPGRVALLVGNRDYPGDMDLPPMHTNVRRLQQALQALGFEVSTAFDQDRAQALASVTTFGRQLQQLPDNGVSLFYFCGHGMQVDAENFLLPARVFPRELAFQPSMGNYVALWAHVLAQLPRRPRGLSMTVIDACRTSPKPLSRDDGLNQVRAPDGELVVFSTGAGKPALTPTDATRLTFFTDALVQRLRGQAEQAEELSFPELFRLVSGDVQRTMRAHPLEDIRELTQVPFIADSTRSAVRVSLVAPTTTSTSTPATAAGTTPDAPRPGLADAQQRAAAEQAAWAELQRSSWPREVVQLADSFVRAFAGSRFASSVQLSREGALRAAQILADPDIGLSRQDFQPGDAATSEAAEDLRRAARGDKDAAARVGERLNAAGIRSAAQGARFEAWMRFAGELENGIAAYELARRYAATGQAALSGQWVSRARKLGYVPPPGLRIGR
jgi:uncharacterized caspase-like protein